MKKALPFITCILFVACISSISFAQDIIIKKNKEEIKAKVQEIGLYEIKYHQVDHLNGPLYVISKDDVFKIIYENGTEILITPDPYRVNQESTILDKTHAVKIEFLAPLTGSLAFDYEHMLKIGTNIEAKFGIIGPSLSTFRNKASGAYVKAGVKFLSGQDFIMDGMRYSHPLKGRYIKLEAIYSYFTQKNRTFYTSTYSGGTYTTASYTSDVVYNAYGFNIVFGKQNILGNMVTLDMYAGIGIGSANANAQNNNVPANDIVNTAGYYSHLFFSKSFPLILSGGISLGGIF